MKASPLHLYVLIGQSNMVGRDTSGLNCQVDDPRIQALDARGGWAVAREPITPDVGNIPGGIGPGISFAIEMLKTADPRVNIGLVGCAVGGSSLSRWEKQGDLYAITLARAHQAAQSGVIQGVLMHQGESDTDQQQRAETYEARLIQMLNDLRKDLGCAQLPVVLGQLGEFMAFEPETYPYYHTIQKAIKQATIVLRNVGYADSVGLGHKGDKLHFSADAARELGKRYAKAMQNLQAR
jgi:hypothetical protein